VLASLVAGSPSVRISDDAAQETIGTRREEAAAIAEAAEAIAEAAEAMVIGDQQTKVYYTSDCSAVSGVKESRRIKFKDKDEAEKAGYKPAKDCQ
jgi:hypothetical protein